IFLWSIAIALRYAVIPFFYILSYFQKSSTTAYAVLTLFGVTMLIISFLIEDKIDKLNYYQAPISNPIFTIIKIIPHYNLIKLISLILIKYKISIIEGTESVYSKAFFNNFIEIREAPNLTCEFLFLFGFGTIMIIAHVFVLFYTDCYKTKKGKLKIRDNHVCKDSDVEQEYSFVKTEANTENSDLILKNIDKTYRIGFQLKKLKVVKNMSLALRKGECFGLLGTNGAGKSTTFKIVIKEESASSGKIYRSKSNEGLFISYCPQTNNLDQFMSPTEHITYLCSIYGYTKPVTERVS
ncbi:hypothetical protein HZS_2428, partial [Henneguya salminicola]